MARFRREGPVSLAVECEEALREQASADVKAAWSAVVQAARDAQAALDAKYPRPAPEPRKGCCGE